MSHPKGSELIEKRCAVTAFDMTLAVTKDGRERGLWFWLEDSSPGRIEAQKVWAKDPQVANKGAEEAALLEWPALEQVYKAIGKELTRRRMVERSQDHKRKVGRRKKAPPRYELVRQETRKPARFPPPKPKP